MSAAPPRVLLVDDEPFARKALKLDLSGRYQVVGEAANGFEALRLVRELDPDIVLTDLSMPVMGGMELARQLDSEGSRATVVVASGAADLDLLREAMAAGAREYLVKPIDRDGLLACLDRVVAQKLERSQAEAAAAERRARPPAAGTWVFTGPKDGDGQTTVVLAIASELLASKHSVVVVDADLTFGDVAYQLGIRKGGPDMADLLSGDDFAEIETIDRHLVRHASGLRLLAAPSDPARSAFVDGIRLAAVIEVLEERFDYVLVDLPFGMGEDVARLLDRARLVFEVSAGDPSRMRHLLSVHAILKGLGFPDEKLLPVLTRVDAERGAELFRAARLERGISIPEDAGACLESLKRGQPVTRVVPQSRFSLAIREILAPILGLPAPERPVLARLLAGILG